jgi:GNAT superfamily N-acetyltransferase
MTTQTQSDKLFQEWRLRLGVAVELPGGAVGYVTLVDHNPQANCIAYIEYGGKSNWFNVNSLKLRQDLLPKPIDLQDAPETKEEVRELFASVGWTGSDPQKWGFLSPSYPGPLHCSDSIPATFVMLVDCKLVGTASIVANDRKDLPHLSPWFAGFIVKPELRELGYGSALLKHVEAYARKSGFATIYLDTERTIFRHDQPEWYQRRGWQFQSPSAPAQEEGIVMYKPLQ